MVACDSQTQVIFSVPSSNESDQTSDGVKEMYTIFTGEASIFHVQMGRKAGSLNSTLTIEQVTAISNLETSRLYDGKTATTVKFG